MTTFTLRPALETDQASIKDLVYSSGINPMGLDWKRFIVAVDPEGQVIGCGQLKPHGKEVLELASIAVKPAHRKQGVARAIIERLLADSPRPLYLMCRSRLEPLYEKFGFRAIPYEEMPRYFQRISRLAGWVEMVARSGEEEGLSIMKLQ
ncbi:MAG TPA: GNAT family N-acetyltransferase [Anaerolineales bacterium]|nr:GNAT family N-acetyltransferase [Anaerolineales bacterium]